MWRRSLFEWETQQLEELLELIQEAELSLSNCETPWWKHEKRGNYTVKSLLEACWNLYPLSSNCSNIWLGMAPPRAELLVWCVLNNRLNTKDRLKKINLIPSSDSLCPFYEFRKRQSITSFFIVYMCGECGQIVLSGRVSNAQSIRNPKNGLTLE